jgi:hypothetical protein
MAHQRRGDDAAPVIPIDAELVQAQAPLGRVEQRLGPDLDLTVLLGGRLTRFRRGVMAAPRPALRRRRRRGWARACS